MLFRNLENGDWTFGRGLQGYVSDADAIVLNVKTRLKSWIGDCFFDQKMGIDWQNRLARFDQRETLSSEIQKMILETDGVLSIDRLDWSMNDRVFSANYTINTVYSKSMSDVLEIGAY